MHWYHAFNKHGLYMMIYLVNNVTDHTDVYKRYVQLLQQNNAHQALICRAYGRNPYGFKPEFTAPRQVAKGTSRCSSIVRVPITSHKVLYLNSKKIMRNEEFKMTYYVIKFHYNATLAFADYYAGALTTTISGLQIGGKSVVIENEKYCFAVSLQWLNSYVSESSSRQRKGVVFNKRVIVPPRATDPKLQ